MKPTKSNCGVSTQNMVSINLSQLFPLIHAVVNLASSHHLQKMMVVTNLHNDDMDYVMVAILEISYYGGIRGPVLSEGSVL